ncbi:MAG: hypothetical protein AAB493_02040 [Patescibacteria group bacterium]
MRGDNFNSRFTPLKLVMDQNFQTSFIPKRPIVEEKTASSSSVGLFTIISLFIFFAVSLGSGGLYFYKGVLEKSKIKMENDLSLAKNRFEPATINRLKNSDERLNAAAEVLSNHIAISPIFQILESLTMKNVRYTKFSYALNNENNVEVKMSGQTIGYRSVALQADLFSKNKNLIDPIFSNLTLDNKGNVLFDLTFSVDPTFVDYKQMLETTSSNSANVGQNGAGI